MSRYPSQGYPPPFPPQQYYSNPDHPIPYRGLSQGDPRSPTSNVSQATSKQEEENDKNAEDGGWGRDGPLIFERKTKKRGHKGMNSHDKTAIWLKTSQCGPSAVAPEQPTAPVPVQESSTTQPPAPKPSEVRKSKSKPPAEVAAPAAEVAAEVIEVKEEQVVQVNDDTPIPVGPDGWPIDLESATTSPGEESQEPSLSTSVKSEVSSTAESQSEQGSAEPASEQTPIEPSEPTSQVDDDPTPPSFQVPSTLPPPVSQGYVYLHPPPPRLQPPWHDPNVLDVVNPRRWGAGQVAVSEAALVNNGQVGGENPEQAWGADDGLAEWRHQVSQQSYSQSEGPPESSASTSEAEEIPDRPDSVPPVPPPVTAYISSESSATSRASTPKPPPLEDEGNTTPPLVRDSASPTLENTLPTPTGPSGRRPSISHVEVDGQVIRSPPRTPRLPRRHGPGSGGSWWKREPHPAYSAEYEARRLLVIFPFPIRIDRIKPIMSDHFSKYGSIRAIQPREMTNEAATKAVVVFWSVDSVENCLADPDRFDCISRSYPTSSRFNIHIEPLPSQTSTIYIKMTGPRCDHRARSASPPNRQGQVMERYEDTRPMPPFITVWGVPELHRWNGRVDWRAQIVMGEEPAEMEWRQAVNETQNEPTLIERIDLARRNPQKAIIPKLCDFFAEIVGVVPPKTTHHGWLITISGQRDGQRLMDQIGQIPGITTRWALAADSQDIPMPTPIQNQKQSRRRSRASPTQRQRTISPISQRPTEHVAQSVVDRNEPAPISPLSARSLPSEYAGLTKTLAPTYKGRLLKEERSEGGSRFVDECAIFVGRLVKGVETESTLLDRFAKYGRICGIEYNPLNNRNTYATARILYGDRASADRALLHEGRAVSHGSGLKIEMRRVLPHDVDMREMYIDEFGRPVSPSMASQYSPPHEHMVPAYPLPPVLSYPPNTAPMSPRYGVQAGSYPNPAHPSHFMPHPNFFPVYFGHPGQMGAPPPSPMAADGNYMGPQPGMWYQRPEGSVIPPFAQNQGQNVGYVPIYPTLPQAQGPTIVPSTQEEVIAQVQTEAQQPPKDSELRKRSPSLPSASSLRAEANTQASSSSGSGSTNGGGLRAVSLREENGVLKAEYDPEELRRYQEEKGYTAHAEPHSAQQAQRVDPEIPRPQSSPGFESRQPEFGNANEYIAYARRGSLATAHTINPRTQEVLTPVPIPFFNHNTQEPYSPPNPGMQVPYSQVNVHPPPPFEYGPVGQRPGPNRYRNRGDGGNHYSGLQQQQGQESGQERPWMGRGW